jgi:hypothetical protein
MKFIKYLYLFLILCLSNNLQAQIKYEKEVRLKRSQVPVEIFDYVNALAQGAKVRWYSQYGIDNKVYEAKFKYQGKNYSVEFFDNGLLKDVEILIDVTEIEAALFEKIDTKLKAELSDYRITRLQLQILASSKDIIQYFRDKSTLSKLTQKYEIVVWTRTNNEIVSYEYLFDSNADIVKKLRVIDKIDDNLVY